jgi:hypothetical protein
MEVKIVSQKAPVRKDIANTVKGEALVFNNRSVATVIGADDEVVIFHSNGKIELKTMEQVEGNFGVPFHGTITINVP